MNRKQRRQRKKMIKKSKAKKTDLNQKLGLFDLFWPGEGLLDELLRLVLFAELVVDAPEVIQRVRLPRTVANLPVDSQGLFVNLLGTLEITANVV